MAKVTPGTLCYVRVWNTNLTDYTFYLALILGPGTGTFLVEGATVLRSDGVLEQMHWFQMLTLNGETYQRKDFR